MGPGRCHARSALAAALERGDVPAAGACYADDAQLLTPIGELIRGRTDIQDYWSTGIALGLSLVCFEARHVERMGARRVEIGRYRVTVAAEPADARSERGTYLSLHRQAVDGTWQRAVDVLDPDQPQVTSAHPQGGRQ